MPDKNAHPLTTLTALSPLDGRYRKDIEELSQYVSEYSLIRTRVIIEAQYLIALSQEGIVRELTADETKQLINLGTHLSLADAEKVKQLEEKTKHDVKAMEMVFREHVKHTSLADLIEMIHFGLTSEDINNIAYRLMLKQATERVMIPSLKEIETLLCRFAKEHKNTPMLARTHGQPAVPTTLGKEFAVFALRLRKQLVLLKNHQFTGKLSGAVGNYNVLSLAYPDHDWLSFTNAFITSFGFSQNIATTQINTYEDIIEYFQIVQRINNILIDFDQDMWRYISDGWFAQEVKKEEVGSSTMPQKVNPILFENSEGNLGMANAMIEFFVRKLPISRLQRDLSDSTVIRNFGICLGYSYLAYNATVEGLKRVRPNEAKMEEALLQDWSILSEAAQTILRRENVQDPYSLLKSLTRGEKIDESEWKEIINKLPVNENVKLSLRTLTPKKYIGLAPDIVDKTVQEIENSKE